MLYQESEVCVMYLNGQYWGQYNLRERINDASICQFEDWEGQEDDIDIVKANSNVMQGSNDTFAALLTLGQEHRYLHGDATSTRSIELRASTCAITSNTWPWRSSPAIPTR